MRRAAARSVDELRRETPVMLRLEDGSIAEGVVDLAFPDNAPGFAGWTIVDFKTDREFAASSDRYITQVELYAEAIGNLMHVPAQGFLLVV
jgi:ATP-dependent helicase/nuclease subunit A